MENRKSTESLGLLPGYLSVLFLFFSSRIKCGMTMRADSRMAEAAWLSTLHSLLFSPLSCLPVFLYHVLAALHDLPAVDQAGGDEVNAGL